MFEIEKTMKRLNLILPIVAIIGLVSLIGHQSENYSSRVIWNVSKDLSVKYFDIKETLGNPQNFSKVVEASIIKKDQSILDLLVVDEMVVVENHAQEYTELVELLPNIENLVHVHKNSDDSNSYVAGGIKILSVEEKDGEFGVFYGPVSKNLVHSLQRRLDGGIENEDTDLTGLVRFNRVEEFGGHFILGLYPRKMVSEN
ncbi:hypothetical protein NO989_18745 [Alteromonas sp. DY56-G5]|uniref:hypothetical protein n=1 Tax=Alteromonas sp. DY56-G5 TaxID=2967128 RepID=UPI00352A2854|tara:strand:- start:409 stop:1008 length:600 start_codon:yes stop_codon:yes gene_type:complete